MAEQGYNPFGGGSQGAGIGGDTDSATIDTEYDSHSSEDFDDSDDFINMDDSDADFASVTDDNDDSFGESNDGGGGGIFDDLDEAYKEAGETLGEESDDEDDIDSADSSNKDGASETGMSDDFSYFTAKWLVDVYANTFCMFMKQYAKINKKTVYEAILAGYLDERFINLIEEENRKVENEIKFSEEQKKFIVEPLKHFVQVNKVKVPTGLQVLIGLGVVSGTTFMTANELRKNNEFMLKKIMQESQRIRQEDTAKAGGQPFVVHDSPPRKEESSDGVN